MARTQKRNQSKKIITFNPRKGLNMSALGNVLDNIGVQITRKQEKALKNHLLKQTSRRTARQTRPVSRWAPPTGTKTKKANNNKKNNVNMGRQIATKKNRAPYKASQLKHVKHLNKYKNVSTFYNQNQMSSHARFGPNTSINTIREAMAQQMDTSSFATPANANLGLATENIEKMKKRKVSAIPFIMKEYQKSPEKQQKAILLQKLAQLYETKKDLHGFSPNTTLYEIYLKLKQADPQNAQVDELTALFQTTGI